MHLLFVLILNSVFCFLGASGTGFIWSNETRLGRYQRAWNSLNKSVQEVYYYVKATELVYETIYSGYNHPELTQFKCWSVQYTNLDKKAQTASLKYYYTLTAISRRGQVHFRTAEGKTTRELGYVTHNAVEYTYYPIAASSGEKEKNPVMFTDGKTCDLFYVPIANNGNGCELWVKSEYKENVPPCCSFMFDLLCGSHGSHDVYDKQLCKRVVDDWETLIARKGYDALI
uniref:Lipocalin n=1 Tax=Amblyomma americanum TaxID=6943 RepID=A0A0C9SED7_AMBAM